MPDQGVKRYGHAAWRPLKDAGCVAMRAEHPAPPVVINQVNAMRRGPKKSASEIWGRMRQGQRQTWELRWNHSPSPVLLKVDKARCGYLPGLPQRVRQAGTAAVSGAAERPVRDAGM